MGAFGEIGSSIGSHLGNAAGNALGGLFGFKKGGRIPGKRGKAKLVVAHAGEYVLPIGVAPTKAQKAAVAKKYRKK